MPKLSYLFIIIILFQISPPIRSNEESTDLTSYVNPFIGTSIGGNTFPGAVTPWGMVSVSPHNSLNATSGYLHGEKDFYGFGMVHLSGTGCAELGSILITVTDKAAPIKPTDYRNSYSNEKASPGYYSVQFDDQKVKADVTVAERTGLLKFTSYSNTEKTIVLDVGRSLGIIGGGKVKIVSENEVVGYNISGGFCGETNREEIYFYARFSKNFIDHKLWVDDKIVDSTEAQVIDAPIGTLLNFNFNENEELQIKVGISYVSIENARLNLENEIPNWNFDHIKKDARFKWEKQLGKIIVEDKNTDNLIKFYTAIYHALIHPNIISDVNGEYPLMGRKATGKYTTRKRYSVFSLWDTYRTLHPFLTLVYPEIQSEIIMTMIDMYKESGYLPKWELAGNETYMMVGDPASIVIADSYIKEITDFNANEAFEAMLKPAMLRKNEKAPPIRAGYHELLQYGYIPYEQDWNDDWWVWGPVSTTLEYCLSDFAISQMALKLNKSNIASEFYRRSLFYKNLFDPVSKFIRPKLQNGNWMEPFDEIATEGSGDWAGSGGPGYVEGNAWNYTWFVPHDILGLIELFGNDNEFDTKLYQAFNEGHFTINNEPDIAYPYLFNYINGSEGKTRTLVEKIMAKDFGIDHAGLPGNDDCGTISAWFVFSALGFYPVCPASEYYQLSYPLFNKITISLNRNYFDGNQLVIQKPHLNLKSTDQIKIYFDDTWINNYKIKHSLLVNGGRLVFKEARN